MGCGGGREMFDDEVDHGMDMKPAMPKGPPTPLANIYDTWPAGWVVREAPPCYIPVGCGPFTRLQKVPPDPDHAGQFLFSPHGVPPRVVAPRGSDDDDQVSVFPDVVDAGASLFARAFLSTSLTGFCIGVAKPDLAVEALVPGFDYNHAINGKADIATIAAGGVIEDVNSRRRLLLYPRGCDALALFVRVDDRGARPRAATMVLPYNGAAEPGRVDAVDDAFVTFSLLRFRGATVGTTASSTRNSTPVSPRPTIAFGPQPSADEISFSRSETSAALTLWNWSHGGTPLNAAFGALLMDLSDGDHKLYFSLAFRYSASTFSAVYVKPSPTPAAATEHVVGQYTRNAESPTTALSDTVAEAVVTVALSAESRQVIREALSTPPSSLTTAGDASVPASHNASLRDDPRPTSVVASVVAASAVAEPLAG